MSFHSLMYISLCPCQSQEVKGVYLSFKKGGERYTYLSQVASQGDWDPGARVTPSHAPGA